MANVGMPSGAFGVCVTVSNHEMVSSPFLSSSFFILPLCVFAVGSQVCTDVWSSHTHAEARGQPWVSFQ